MIEPFLKLLIFVLALVFVMESMPGNIYRWAPDRFNVNLRELHKIYNNKRSGRYIVCAVSVVFAAFSEFIPEFHAEIFRELALAAFVVTSASGAYTVLREVKRW